MMKWFLKLFSRDRCLFCGDYDWSFNLDDYGFASRHENCHFIGKLYYE